MYTNISTNKKYPKTLIIRNHLGGLIWQVYNVDKEKEAKMISERATMNGFEAITLEDFNKDIKETWPDWRSTSGGKEITNEY